jgi:hypothetical protein
VSIVALLLLGACGGGGGGGGDQPQPPSASITFSADQLSFATTGPWDDIATPATLKLTGTVQGTLSGTLNIVIQVNNPELVTVGDLLLIGPNSGEVTITPASASTLSIGRHTGSIVVRACMNDTLCNSNQLQGSPKTIGITYEIPTNVDGDAVMPHVVRAGAPGGVIIRGNDFPAGATVSFGGIAADTVNVVRDSEICATYPALSAGTHAIAINSGAVAFSASVAVVADTSYSAVLLPHPTPGLAFPRSLEYDAERQAIIAVLLVANEDTRIVRYAYDGTAWASPTSVVLPGIAQARLTPDGSKLLVLLPSTPQTVIEERDPVTLDLQRSNSLPGHHFGAMAFTNDSNALLAANQEREYVFGLHSRGFRPLPLFLIASNTVASADGSFGAFFGDRTLYDTSTGRFTQLTNDTTLSSSPASADLTGAKFHAGLQLFDKQFAVAGSVPFVTSSVADVYGSAIINRAGTRLYTPARFGNSPPQLYTWDLTVPTVGGKLVQAGNPVDLTADPGLHAEGFPDMTISPDDRTVFIGGSLGIVVMPAPQ